MSPEWQVKSKSEDEIQLAAIFQTMCRKWSLVLTHEIRESWDEKNKINKELSNRNDPVVVLIIFILSQWKVMLKLGGFQAEVTSKKL